MQAFACCVLPLSLLSLASCGAPDPDSDDRPPIELADLEGVVEFGSDASSPLSLLHRVVDGVFLGDEIVILDASSPWIRVYDRSGSFRRSMLEEGQGPGEAEDPVMLGSSRDEELLVHDRRGVLHLDRTGALQSFTPRTPDYMSRGTVQACADDLFAMGYPPMGEDPPGVISRIDSNGVLFDTLIVFGPVRFNNRRHHPWFSDARDDGILFYPEERDRYRILEIDCEGAVLREIPIDSLGPGERWDDLSLHPPAPPLPAGLVRLGDRVLWATNMEDAGGRESVDSLTAVTSFEPDGSTRRVFLNGWYRLLASDPDGTLLLSNTWGAANSSGTLPRAWTVNGAALLRRMH